MVLAKPWYHTSIICAKKSFNTIKNCKKGEIVYVTTSSYNYYLTRSVVEETTFEAKAKDFKKIRGQS